MKSFCKIVCFLLLATVAKAQYNYFKPKYSVVLDSTNGPAIINQCSRDHPKNVSSFWNVSADEISLLEKNFGKVLIMRIKDDFGNTRVCDLNHFVYQYMGLTISGERYIYINASAGFFGNENLWRYNPVNVCDGGGSYWGALFNLQTKQFSQLAFDGSL